MGSSPDTSSGCPWKGMRTRERWDMETYIVTLKKIVKYTSNDCKLANRKHLFVNGTSSLEKAYISYMRVITAEYLSDTGILSSSIMKMVYMLLCVVYGHYVTSSENLPTKIMVQCGTQQCNILEEFCSIDNRCDKCNEDECKLPKAAGERPPQCFFKCNQVMEKLKNLSNAGSSTWRVYFLISYAAVVTLLCIFLLVWVCKKRKTGCCVSKERQSPSEERALVSHSSSQPESESPLPVPEPSRRSPVIASPQNDRENETTDS
ncbi:uncharacterized protein LOC117331798 [Pecten maximus]|uniref:uncharacterized protein LOC117331798 n=1 Tax=Pecten maximus TaxID=6579 RepID=UPI001458DACE|nr:uncharacterized protein LOC117331798 [Pecten maximus]